MEMNMSSSGLPLAGLFPTQIFSWMITIAVFIMIIGIIFMLSKHFRDFIIGGVITSITYGVYSLSKFIGVRTISNDIIPLKVFLVCFGFITVSIFVGMIISKTKYGKIINKWVEDKAEISLENDKNEK